MQTYTVAKHGVVGKLVWQNICSSVIIYQGWRPWRCQSLPHSIGCWSKWAVASWTIFLFPSAVALSDMEGSLWLWYTHCAISEISVPLLMGWVATLGSCLRPKMTVHGIRKRDWKKSRGLRTGLGFWNSKTKNLLCSFIIYILFCQHFPQEVEANA